MEYYDTIERTIRKNIINNKGLCYRDIGSIISLVGMYKDAIVK